MHERLWLVKRNRNRSHFMLCHSAPATGVLTAVRGVGIHSTTYGVAEASLVVRVNCSAQRPISHRAAASWYCREVRAPTRSYWISGLGRRAWRHTDVDARRDLTWSRAANDLWRLILLASCVVAVAVCRHRPPMTSFHVISIVFIGVLVNNPLPSSI